MRRADDRRWLILGAGGMLGTDLLGVLADRGIRAVGVDRSECDITSPFSMRSVIADAAPDVIVNAAAYTAVDHAEVHEDASLLANGIGPRVIAHAAARSPRCPKVLHVSTDYVFDGTASSPYPEEAEPSPASAYGRTKLVGEAAVRDMLPDHGYVVRTAWLYGEHGSNFVRTMLRLQAEQERISVVTDQCGQPTWSRDLAAKLIEIADAPAGIYHGTSSGAASWYDLAREVFRLVGADPDRVLPTTTAAFPRPAPRPAYSVLGHEALRRAGIEPIRPWQEALAEALPRLMEVPRAA